MFNTLSLTHSVFLSLLLLLSIFILWVVILPFKRVTSYKKEGIEIFFFPLLGIRQYWVKSFKQKGDVMAGSKEAFKNCPNAKLLVTNLKRTPLFLLRDPRYIKEFLQKQVNYYHKSRIFDTLRYLAGNGLASSDGDDWKHHRKIISSSFNFEFLKKNIHVIQDTAREFLDKIIPSDSHEYLAIKKIQEITGEIVGKIFFSENLKSYTFEGKSLTTALAEITSELGSIQRKPLVTILGTKIIKSPLFPRYYRMFEKVRKFREVCFQIIRDRKAQPNQSTDLLGSLLATQRSEDPENRFSDEDIVDEFITFFIAGMDTTGHLLGMSLYTLTQYPQYLQLLQEERDATYNKEKNVSTDTLHKMDLLHSFLKETLRFFPPAALLFIRISKTDHKLLDLDIRKGDYLSCDFMALPFDEKHFKNAFEFNPSRWMISKSKLDPYAFTPFSAGPRNCIGQHLAIIESKIIMSEFLERFEFKLKEGYDFKMVFRFLYEPLNDVPLYLSSKSKKNAI